MQLFLIMDNSFFRINDFTSKKKFEKLKNTFVTQDIDFYSPNVKKNFDKTNPIITILEIIEIDDEISDTIVIQQEFLKDFLLSGIINIVENEMADFYRYCYEKGVVTKQAKKELLSLNQSFKNELKAIAEAEYLNEEVKSALKFSIDKLINEYKKNIDSDYRKIPKRLKFNWKKNKIEALFFLLWENNYINASKPADIGNVLDFCFEYLEEEDEKKGKYIEINNSRKELSDFTRAKGDKTPIKELQEIFSKADFYNH